MSEDNKVKITEDTTVKVKVICPECKKEIFIVLNFEIPKFPTRNKRVYE